MQDLLDYYNKFTPDELQILEEQYREWHILYGMLKTIKLVEDLLGHQHHVTIELRKEIEKQRYKFSSIKLPQTLRDKLFEDLVSE